MGNPIVVTAMAGWLALAVAGTIAMSRRGHDPFAWAVTFVVLGPLAVPLALDWQRRRAPEPVTVATGRPQPRAGRLHVVVGIDGSAAAERALADAVGVLGPYVTAWTLATVVDVDAPATVSGKAVEDRARASLASAAELVPGFAAVEQVVLYGAAGVALHDYALEHDADLLVVGAATRELRHVLHGSATRRLTAHPEVPVFVCAGTVVD
jgi:nucleotide-binding universal stress UspA family protein